MKNRRISGWILVETMVSLTLVALCLSSLILFWHQAQQQLHQAEQRLERLIEQNAELKYQRSNFLQGKN